MTPAKIVTRALTRADGEPPKLVAFLTGGYPDREGFVQHLVEMGRAADLIEVGIPFSDPMADGLTIQNASRKVLEQGESLASILECLTENRNDVDAPVVLMGYLNPLLAYGYEQLAKDAKMAGVCGFVVPDLPVEESAALFEALEKRGLALIQLITPVTPPERLAMLCERSRGFVYAVTQTGTTGDAQLDASCASYLQTVRAQSELPVCAGFGIRTAEDVGLLADHVDGVVVGTALIDAIDKGQSAKEFLEGLRRQ